jgi:hypothetical protein
VSFRPTSGLTPGGLRATNNPAPVGTPAAAQTVTGLTREGLRRIAGVEAATLSTKQRKALPDSAFVFPDKAPGSGSYPIGDRAHAANALARSSGTPEAAAVKRKVCSRYPDLPACKE